MALAYLLDPTKQYQNVAGVNNVAGWLEVFISDTPERADVYVDFAGTRAPERIGIDNNGRAVMIVDSDGVYRVEMHAPNGDLLWTQYPIWPVGQGGGGALGVDIGSSDGSIDVQRTQVGSVVNYDLSVAADGTDLLGWGEFVGYTMDGTHMVPSYNAGTIVTGPHGIRLQGGQYYHVTAALGASSVEQNVYDAFQVSFKGIDGDGVVSTFSTKSFHYDASTGESQSYDVSFDMMPAADVELYAEATGLESGISVGISETYVHRVYSGAPFVPDIVVDKDWVEDNFQEKLVAGQNITIEDNVISATAEPQVQADWAQSDSEAVDYIKNKPDLSVYATQTDLTTGLATKQDVISDLATIRAGAAAGATAVQPADLATVATTGDYADLLNKPTIPSGSQLVPSATPSDAGEVLTVDQQGVPAWAPAQAPISAGNGVDITNNVVSAKVDGTSITFNASGELEATVVDNDSAYLAHYGTTTYAEISAAVAAGKAVFVTDVSGAITAIMPMTSFNTNPAMVIFTLLIGSIEYKATLSSGTWSSTTVDIQADWNEASQLSPAYINNKPTIPSGVQLVPSATSADEDKVLTVDSQGVPGWAATAQVQSDWAESDPADVSFIQNKPGQTNLVAGTNITIVDDVQNNTVTISSTGGGTQVQADWAESDPNDPSYIQNKPDLSVYATNTALTNGLATKQDTISDLATIRSGAAAGATAVQPADLATVATTGDYADLLNKPTIPVIGTISL